MYKKLSLATLSAVAGLAVLINSLNAADAPAAASASAKASGSAAPAAASASAKASASAASGTAAKPDLTKLPKASDKKDLTFDKDIQPILKASCSGCHIASQRPRGGLDLTTLAAALKGGTANKDKDIVPGHGDQSFVLLYAADLVKGKEMPPMNGRTAHPAIKVEDLGLIRAWIDQGAK